MEKRKVMEGRSDPIGWNWAPSIFKMKEEAPLAHISTYSTSSIALMMASSWVMIHAQENHQVQKAPKTPQFYLCFLEIACNSFVEDLS